MNVWYRVFATNSIQPDAGSLMEFLNGLGAPVFNSRFHTDDHGWYAADLLLTEEGEPLGIDRYLSTEEGVRDELNAWAAWVEAAANPNQGWLMEHLIRTTQVFSLDIDIGEDNLAEIERVCTGLCRFLAQETAGVYQVDGQGFFAADGTLLIGED